MRRELESSFCVQLRSVKVLVHECTFLEKDISQKEAHAFGVRASDGACC